MTDDATLDALAREVYARRPVGLRVRIRRGARWHVGYLTVTTTVGGGRPGRTTVEVRDSSRGARSQYALVTPRALDAGEVQVKVGARYVDVREAWNLPAAKSAA